MQPAAPSVSPRPQFSVSSPAPRSESPSSQSIEIHRTDSFSILSPTNSLASMDLERSPSLEPTTTEFPSTSPIRVLSPQGSHPMETYPQEQLHTSELHTQLEQAGSSPMVSTEAGPEQNVKKEALGLKGWPEEAPLQETITWLSKSPSGVRDTWWPMASWGIPTVGNPLYNHWAWGGPCAKFDDATGAKSRDFQYKYRRRTGNDVLDAIKHKMGIADIERFDGLNAGHCNQVAGCSALFDNPTAAVIRPLKNATASRFTGFFSTKTVTFSPRDISGLMALCFDDLVKDINQDGAYGFTYEGYRFFDPPEDVDAASCTDPKHPLYRGWNDPNNPYPHRVINTVIMKWMLQENRKVIADRRPGADLDNFCYDGCQLTQLRQPPKHFDDSVIPSGGIVRYFEISLIRQAAPSEARNLPCWLHTAEDGQITSCWIRPPVSSYSLSSTFVASQTDIPTFYWLANLKDSVKNEAPWIGFANSTNPEIDMLEVWRLYKDSTVGQSEREKLEEKWADRIKMHAELVEQKEANSVAAGASA